MHRSLLSVVLSLSVLLSMLVAAQAAEYTFTTFDAPGATQSFAIGINTAGQVVGSFYDGTKWHGFVTDGATFTPIDVPGATYTQAYRINDSGQIVGMFSDSGGNLHGFVKDGATFTPIDVPGATYSEAWGINDSGQIVGLFVKTVTGEIHGFVTDGATFTPIDVPGATHTQAFGINDNGQIVGVFQDTGGNVHGFVKDGATFTPIDVPGAIRHEALGINDSGQIVGVFYDTALEVHGFVKDGATFTPIDVPGATLSEAWGINDSGQIVGTFVDAAGQHSFLATPVPVDTTAPVITIAASPETLWPPNGKLVDVRVSGRIADASGVQVGSAEYVVLDEYDQIELTGRPAFGPGGQYAFTVQLPASRQGHDRDGRRYTIVVGATDNAGNVGRASTSVTVPH